MEALFQARAERRDWKGLAGSVLLHGLAALMALWYIAHRAEVPQAVFHVLPVEIVIGGASGSGDTAPAARLQVAPPHREAAPVREGTNPQGKVQPEDELSAKLRALAQLQAPPSSLPNADNTAAPGGTGGGLGEGNYALRDYIRAQILRRWLPDLAIKGARDMPVLVRIRLLSSGVIADVVILDQARMKTDEAFRDMALSARDAALLASPIPMPPGHYEKVQTLTIDLDPKAVLR
jgi:hypothetical protein